MTFEEWLEARLPALLRLASALCGPQAAEDVVQDVLIRVHARWARIAALEDPDAYVRRMVVNEHLSWRRRLALSLRRGAAAQALAADPATTFDQDWADREELVAAITRLPPRQRAVVVLRYLEDLSVAETARLLGCAEGTVRGHTARALAALRVGLGATAPTTPTVKEHHAH